MNDKLTKESQKSREGAPAEARDGQTPCVIAPALIQKQREDLGRKAKELASAAMELEQAALFNEPVFEEALLLENEEIRRRYTGENAKQIEWRRDAAVYMLARQCPVEEIARVLHMNTRLVAAIAAQRGAQFGQFTEKYAQELMASAAGDIALADTKKHEASYLQLVTGAGIKTDKALAIKQLGAMQEDASETIDADGESEALKKFREGLKPLIDANKR